MRAPFLHRIAAVTLLLSASLAPALAQTATSEAQHPASAPAPAGQAAPANPGPRANPQSQGGGNGGVFIDSKTATSQNLAKAEQEDDEYVFMHSAAVRYFGRKFHLSPDAASMAFWALNAAILFAFVGYFLATGLPKAFRSRRQQLDRQIVEARTATEKAEERLRAVEERLGRLDSEIAAVREQAERDSANDETRLKQAMEDEKHKIVASAEQEIAAAGAAAERRLRKFAAELAVDRATSRLHLTEGDDRTLIQEFAASLGSNGSQGGAELMADFAARYARALADVVVESHLPVDQLNAQLQDFISTLAESADLRQALFNPALAVDVRVRVIDALAPRLHLVREVRNFLAVLLRHGRMSAIEEIVAEFRAELDRRQGISEVEVISARRLDADERSQMEQHVARLAGTRVRARFREDNSLIGGAVVRIGSTIYDGSVRGRLDRMKQELIAG